MDHLNGQNYTAHSVRFSEMEQNSQKISTHEQLKYENQRLNIYSALLEYKCTQTAGICIQLVRKDHTKNQVNTTLKNGTRPFFLIVLSVI